MPLHHDALDDRFEALHSTIPAVEAHLQELMSLEPVDFSGLVEKSSALIASTRTLRDLTYQLMEQSLIFKNLFAHDAAGALFTLEDILDDIRLQASSLFDNQSLDQILTHAIGVQENEKARMEVDFVDALREMMKQYCIADQVIVDADSDDDSDILAELRDKASKIAIEPYQLRQLREEVLEKGIAQFDTLFLEYFGGSCVGVDFEGLRQRVRAYCIDPSETAEGISDTDNDLLRLIRIEKRDVDYWRFEVRDHAATISDARSQVWIALWTILRTIESIGYRASGHVMNLEARSVEEFLRDAEPILQSVFAKKGGESPVQFQNDGDAVVLMHQGTVGALILNIAANAAKRGKATTLHITSTVQEDSVQITCEDDGGGFPLDIADRIYEPGFSGGASTGLGLADADKRMSMTGGSIHADGNGGLINKDGGKGAKFTLTLPRTSTIT